MSDKKGEVIKGRVFSGLGRGTSFTQLDWVRQQCQQKLGFVPFAGTLNLKVDQEYLDLAQKLRTEEGVDVVPPTPEFCQAKAFPISISGIKAAIIIPDAQSFTDEVHPPDIIEVIAPVEIKKALSIKDGDKLAITLK